MNVPSQWKNLSVGQKVSLISLVIISLAIPVSVTLTQRSGGVVSRAEIPITPPITNPGSKIGDANGDGKVNGIDYVIWLNNYGDNVSTGASQGDFDFNGLVDGRDYVVWLNRYNS